MKVKYEEQLPEANYEWGNLSWGRRLGETGEPMDKKRIEGRRDGQAGTTPRNPQVQATEVNATVVPGSIVFLPGEALPPSRGQGVSRGNSSARTSRGCSVTRIN